MDTRHRTALLVTGLLWLFTAVLSIAASIAANALPDAWTPYLWLAWPVFFGATTIVIILAVCLFFLDRRASTAPTAMTGDQARAQRNRRTMLERVRQFWIKGVLEQSLYAVARLELGLTTQPDAVEDS